MKKLLVCLLAGALLTSAALTAEAAKQIAFGKGKSSASVNGKIQGSNDVDHVIRASAGQTMTVDFKAGKGAAYFNVLPPGSPVYKDNDSDDKPTGGWRQLQYKLTQGEASWVLKLDKVLEF